MRAFLSAAVLTASLAATASSQTVAGPDAFGYVADAITNNFLDISVTGTDVTGMFASLDDAGITVPIGFSFSFYGTVQTTFGLSTNGYLADDPDLADAGNDCPPANPFDPDRGVYAYWDDLSLDPLMGNHGSIYTQLLGVSPFQRLVVQWEDVGAFADSTASLTFQAHLLETDPVTMESNVIELHYGTMTSAPGFDATGGGATIGVERDSTAGLNITCNIAGVITGNSTAYRIRRDIPAIQAPTSVVPGDVISVTGIGEPNQLYAVAFSLGSGPICPCLNGTIPQLDLGLDAILVPGQIFGIGGTGADGTFTAMTAAVPLMGAECVSVNIQGVTFPVPFGSAPGAASNVKVTTVFPLTGQTLTGSLLTTAVSDLYTFTGTAGDIVEINLCRTVLGVMDPFVCLEDPTGTIVAFDDDSGNASCGAGGAPGSNSFISATTLMMSGTYTIRASSFQGQGNEIGDYAVTLFGCSGQDLALSVDEAPVTCN